MSGVLPHIFASTILSLPTSIRLRASPTRADLFYSALWYQPDHLCGFVLLLIMAFNYYVTIQYNPIEIATLPQEPGTARIRRRPTAEFLQRVVSRTTVMGGVFLSIIAVAPILVSVISGGRLNISLGGTSLIIVVGVALDTVKSLESMMMMRHYKGFLE